MDKFNIKYTCKNCNSSDVEWWHVNLNDYLEHLHLKCKSCGEEEHD